MSALLLLALSGCSEQGFNNTPDVVDVVATPTPTPPDEPPTVIVDASPDILVDPLQIDFGIVPAGFAQTGAFTVSNVGDATLSVSEISIVGDPGFALSGSTVFALEPGESTVLDVTFLSQGGQSLASAVVVSDDPDEGVIDVLLLGSGVSPDLEITPLVDFGTLEVPCSDLGVFTLSNVGGDVLTVDALTFDDLSGTMTIESAPPLPFTIDPNGSKVVTVRYSPIDPGVSTGLLTAASDDPDGDETAEAVGVATEVAITDAIITPPDPPLDIVFVVDQSGSMDAHAQNMADALDDLILGLAGVTNDWRIGVVTFDDGCFNTWFDATTPNFAPLFESAVREGSQNDPDNQDTERLFALAGRALQQGQPGLCNDGFRRADGFLHVIMVSDEEEQSHDPNDTQVPYNTIAGAIGVYDTFVLSSGMLQVSAVANLTNDCQSQNDAIAQGAARYIEMSSATGGLALDICDNQWGTRMGDLGSQLPAEYTVPLSALPDAGSISVVVNGGVLIGGYTYDPVTNSVVVTAPLGAGSTIDVSYLVPPVCN